MLDLRVAEVADRALVAEAPEVEVGAAERVPDALEGQGRRVLGAEALEVRLGLLDLDRGAGRGRSDERRGDREAAILALILVHLAFNQYCLCKHYATPHL